MWRKAITRRRLLALGATVPVVIAARPAAHLTRAAFSDGEGSGLTQSSAGIVDDASGMSRTLAEVIVLEPGRAEAQLGELFARARTERRAISIAGARHTMGGHTSSPNGLVVDMTKCRKTSLAEGGELLTVGAGARWSDVIPHLHARGRSVAVMQSNSSFSVGGSISANAHGWQHSRPPIASTVDSFRIVLADGRALRASRTENRELFTMALGGYGLFGVILEADLRVVPDEMYTREQHEIPADDYVATFVAQVDRARDVGMAYGRVAVCPRHFLTRAILTTYRRDPGAGPIPPLAEPASSRLSRAVFRGSVGSDYGKDLRWDLERTFGGEAGGRVSRNQILSEPVALFQNRDPSRSDILHEYFVPPVSFAPFLARMRTILPKHGQDLLNLTVRNVAPDDDAFLRYADQPMFSLVLLFNHARTGEADEAMARLSSELIEAALAVSGRHYLPYRLHATREQLARGYPRSAAFFAAKRAYDPELLFRNHFFDKYGA